METSVYVAYVYVSMCICINNNMYVLSFDCYYMSLCMEQSQFCRASTCCYIHILLPGHIICTVCTCDILQVYVRMCAVVCT